MRRDSIGPFSTPTGNSGVEDSSMPRIDIADGRHFYEFEYTLP